MTRVLCECESPFHIAELDWDSDGFVKAEEIPASIATYILLQN